MSNYTRERSDLVKREWRQFRKAVIPKDAPPVQVSEMELAFYAAAAMMFNELIRIGVDESDNQEKVDYELQKIHNELHDFAAKKSMKAKLH